MGIEEVDDAYRRDIEQADKNFVEAINKKVNLKTAEGIYLGRLKAAREKYARNIEKNLGELRGGKKKKPKDKEKQIKPFKVNLDSYDLTFFERVKFGWGFFKFRNKIRLRNFHLRITPSFVSYGFIVIKLKIGRLFRRISNKLNSAIDAVRNFFAKAYEGLKEAMKKVYEKTLNAPDWFMTKLKSLKGKKGEKKEEEKKEEKKEE